MRNLLSNSLKVCAFALSILLSVQATAQTVQPSQLTCTPAQAHCTSKDLAVVDLFVQLPPCASCNGTTVTAPLIMVIHNGTKSLRAAFALWGTLSSGASINGVAGNIFVCVGAITVKSDQDVGYGLGNQAFTVGNIQFSCGQSLTLTNNLMAWTDASGTTESRCNVFAAATTCANIEPKCGEVPSITIRQPLTASSSSAESCSNSATGSVTVTVATGAGTAPYVITIDGTTFAAGSPKTKTPLAAGNYNWTVTDGAGCTTSGTQTVSSVSCCVSPTINANPTSTNACPGNPASFTASATGGEPTPTVQWQEKVGAGSFTNITNAGVYSGATTGTLTISDVTGKNGNQYRAVFTSAGCAPATSNPATLTVNAVPSNPDVTYIPPACDETTFSLRVGSNANPVLEGAKYTIVDKDHQPIADISPSASPYIATAQDAGNKTIVFGNIPAGSGYLVTIESGAGCVPSGAALPCGDPTPTDDAGKRAPSPVSQNVETQTTTVKAYPNPFSDRIKFVVNSSVGGNGVLDVYNMTGQKVKTVHQGYIAAGTQTFELSLPTQQVANLIYVLRIGDKKMSGKILQINR